MKWKLYRGIQEKQDKSKEVRCDMQDIKEFINKKGIILDEVDGILSETPDEEIKYDLDEKKDGDE